MSKSQDMFDIKNKKQNSKPKIIYRSDSTGMRYEMWIHGGTFEIYIRADNGAIKGLSPCYAYLTPWRLTINRFFDIVDNHINTGEWMP